MAKDEVEGEEIEAYLDALEAHGRSGKELHASTSLRERAILAYAIKLTHSPAEMTPEDLDPLREAGLDDGEILDANQVVAYFAYVNRLADGLGVELEPWHRD